MPTDGFKTQVLLLHSEQSTLDSLSSGFGDSFTVHCATSGSEALNTLGETPINVIVTAQDLPGMSGLEALREAKKRSPETIGILLAGDADEGLEALVSDKEVFQVVRGNITGDTISRLVENATQQMRLTALSNSANDAAANVDEPSDEHIVMETHANGSTLISDGTGRVPVLDPAAAATASTVGSHAVDLLVLTKDGEFLQTIKDSSRGTHSVHFANTLAQADKIIRKHQVGVAVVDAAMVGERIEQLTLHLRKGSPRLVSVVAGRRDDGEMMMDLINRSKVYRFLLKPVSPGRARLAIEASVKHHLEGPDSAFKTKGRAQTTAPSAKQTQALRAAKAGPGAAAPGASEPPAVPAPPMDSADDGASANDDTLSDAFGHDDSSFNETVTGLFSTVSKKLSRTGEQPALEDRSEAQSAVTAAPSGGSRLKLPAFIGLGAAAVVVIAGAFFWLSKGGDDAQPSVEAVTDAPAVAAPQAAADSESSVIVEGDAVDVDAATNTVDAGPDIGQALADAELALLESRIVDAESALELVATADPENTRLPFLNAQLAQLQLRDYLADARAAIRESRFDDAQVSLDAARALGLTDSAEIDAVEIELGTARSDQQIDEVLAAANARLDDGDLLEPANDNARYYFELALASDPENVAARQGLGVIASKLLLQARSETDNGNFDVAEALIADATAVDPGNGELAVAVAAVADKRSEIAEQRRRNEARRRAEAERLAAAERKAEEERVAAQAAAATPPVKEAVELPPGDSADAGIVETIADDSPATDPVAPSAAAAAENVTDDARDEAIEPESAPSVPAPTSVSALKRIKYVAPKYPRAAERRNLSGWVDVVFTVDRSGLVKDVEARDSEPGETFVNAATKAVAKWEFEPVIENGEVVEKRAGVRLMFALE